MIYYREGCKECEQHNRDRQRLQKGYVVDPSAGNRRVDRRSEDPVEVPTTPQARAGRRACYEPAIYDVVLELDSLLKVRRKDFETEYERKHPRSTGMFSAAEVEWALYRLPTEPTYRRMSPKVRYANLDQSKISPLRRFYEFPAKTFIYHSTYLRQLTPEERRVVTHYAMIDYLERNPTVLRVVPGKGLRYRFVGS